MFKKIAAALGVNRRYVGDEPFSQVTSIYNQIMKEELDAAGVECVIVPRREDQGTAISASKVRLAIQEDRLEDIRGVVPETTYAYFTSEAAEPVIRRIREAAEVIHY